MIAAQALRMLWREWRSGELRLLLLALMIAVAASSAVGFFTDRVERALIRQASEYIGADLVISSTQPIAASILDQAQALQLQLGQQRTLRSMLLAGEQMLLVGLKAVDASYPMKGELRLRRQLQQQATAHLGPPAPGTLWVEPRVLEQLQLQPGAEVELGVSRLRITALLAHEPDRGGGLFSLNPRAMIHLDDLAATQLVQPGSRVGYRYLFSGDATAIARFRDWVKPQLSEGERLLDINDESPALGGTLQRAQRYLNLSGLVAAAMAAIAIALAAQRYTQRHYDTAAMLRSFGLSRQRILRLFGWQLLLCGISAAIAGVVVGWLAQQGLVILLGQLVPAELPASSWRPALIGAATGLLILCGTTLPPLLQLAAVAPLRVLRRDLAPLPPTSLLIYLLTSLCGVMLLWLYSQDLELALLIGLGGGLGALLLAGGGWLLLRLSSLLPGPLAWRLTRTNLLRHRRASLSQIAAFGLTLAAMALILLVRTDLLQDWRNQLPTDAPNHFLINIQPWESDALNRYLTEREITHAGLYPLIRGRLTHINATPANQRLTADHPGRRATRRELNLTWSAELPSDNRIQSGRWWLPTDSGQPRISLEQKLA
ncbi:MAG TPA: FtsX-like permease family protein, partial [Motiliproteus sp.]